MSQMFAFSLLMVILYIGDVVSIKTKAWIPSVFVCGVLFIPSATKKQTFATYNSPFY
jgi:hypothetical protein